MLESTNWKVIEIANAVGYENQGKFANSSMRAQVYLAKWEGLCYNKQ